jgi:hypothetical protein
MRTERAVRRITWYADMIGNHAIGLAAQHAVSNDGTDADQSDPAIHTVLHELRKAGYRSRSRPQGIRWPSPGRGLCYGSGDADDRCGHRPTLQTP